MDNYVSHRMQTNIINYYINNYSLSKLVSHSKGIYDDMRDKKKLITFICHFEQPQQASLMGRSLKLEHCGIQLIFVHVHKKFIFQLPTPILSVIISIIM